MITFQTGNKRHSGFRLLLIRTFLTGMVLLVALPVMASEVMYVLGDFGNDINKIDSNGNSSRFVSSLLVDGLATDASGNLFAARPNGPGAIYKITPDGSISTFVSILSPNQMAFDHQGNLLVVSTFDRSISRITPSGSISLLYSNLANPQYLALDSADNIYFGSGGGNSIYKIVNGTPTVIASAPVPGGLAFDSQDNLFAVSNTSILKITPTGTVTTFASGLNYPLGLAMGSGDNLYYVDSNLAAVRMITPSGTISTYANTGLSGPRNIALVRAVPEPGVMGLVGIGALLFFRRRARR